MNSSTNNTVTIQRQYEHQNDVPSNENNNTAFSINWNVRMSINGDEPTHSMPNNGSSIRQNQCDPRIPANTRTHSNRSSFDGIDGFDESSNSSDTSDTEGSEYSESGDATELEILRKKYATAKDQIARLVREKEQRNFDLISVLKHNKETRMILKMQKELLEDCFLSYNPNTQFDSNLFNWMDSTISQIILNQSSAGWNDEMSISETNATVQRLKSNDLINLPMAQAMFYNRSAFDANVQNILRNLSAQRHPTNRNQ